MTKSLKRIGTHSGIFHCDEVLACFMLKKLPEFSSSEIIRTRDDKTLDSCDIVVDVGGIYDPSKQRYDHHQRGFTHTMNSLLPSRPWQIKLSSAGLIYHHFGERVLESVLGSPQEPELLKNLYNYCYENFIQEVDAIDNGVPMFDGEPKYRINTNLSARVGHLNPPWNTEKTADVDKLFTNAMDLVGNEFLDRIHYFTQSFWPARKIIVNAVENRFNVHKSGEIIELSTSCPWKEHLVQLEADNDLKGVVKFVIFSTENDWRVQGIPIAPNSFICRVFLYEKWQGLRDNELSKVSGIDDCIFVHATGFIGGNKTREGALAMAVKSLELSKNK